jgi:hypothetical protein
MVTTGLAYLAKEKIGNLTLDFIVKRRPVISCGGIYWLQWCTIWQECTVFIAWAGCRDQIRRLKKRIML